MIVRGCGECGWEAPIWWTVEDFFDHTDRTGHSEFISINVVETPWGWRRYPAASPTGSPPSGPDAAERPDGVRP